MIYIKQRHSVLTHVLQSTLQTKSCRHGHAQTKKTQTVRQVHSVMQSRARHKAHPDNADTPLSTGTQSADEESLQRACTVCAVKSKTCRCRKPVVRRDASKTLLSVCTTCSPRAQPACSLQSACNKSQMESKSR